MDIKKIKDLKVGDYIYILECKKVPSEFYKRKIVDITRDDTNMGTFVIIKYHEDDKFKQPFDVNFKEDVYVKHVYVYIDNIDDYKIVENNDNTYYSDLNQLKIYVESLYYEHKKAVSIINKLFDKHLKSIDKEIDLLIFKEIDYCGFEKLESIEQLKANMLLYNPGFGNYEVSFVYKENNKYEIQIIDNPPNCFYETINNYTKDMAGIDIFNGEWLIVNESQ